MKKILIHDANNACWRLMKIMPVLTTNGKPVQMVYGFLRLIRNSIEEFSPNKVLVCWDSGRSKFRQELYKDYKGNRNHTKDKEHAKEFSSFMQQAEVVKNTLKFLNIAQLDYPESEADDLIAVACDRLIGKKIVVSSDMDMLQLVDIDTSVWSPIKKELFTYENFRKKIGLDSQQYLQLRAMVGDNTDNITGAAKGFGEATAKELLLKYKDLDTLYSPSVEKKIIKKGNRYALLYSDGARERIYRNLTLMDLKIVAAMNPNHNKVCKLLQENIGTRVRVSHSECHKFFSEQKFDSLMKEGLGVWLSPFETLDV